ncbi:peptidase [Enterococcus faecium]|nr:peptidase [Enterococcus faecium]PQC37430.1 peptidase [Enterococcus faecium]PQC93050.1 peptidase [Enterococcus faecium]
MTLKKALFIKGFMIVDRINRLLLYQAFKALFFKKHFKLNVKKFLWGIIHLFLFERCFLVCR